MAETQTCKECEGTNFVIKGETRELCGCIKKRKIQHYLRTLGRLSDPGELAIKVLEKVDPSKNLYILCNERDMAKISGMFAFLLIRRARFDSFKVMNVYELIEVFLGKHDDADSIFKLNDSVLMLTNGFQEMENRRQEDLILQTLENRRRSGKVTWFYNRGRSNPLKLVDSFLRENGFEVVDIDAGKSTRSKLR